jgi:hypothetical protein
LISRLTQLGFEWVNVGERYGEEDLHRAKAYERDLATQRRSEARRAEEGRQAADRGRMAGALPIVPYHVSSASTKLFHLLLPLEATTLISQLSLKLSDKVE